MDFKQQPLKYRLEIYNELNGKYKDRCLVVLIRGNSNAPVFNRTRFIMKRDMVWSNFIMQLRSNNKIGYYDSLFFFAKNNTYIPFSSLLGEIYDLYAEYDGFLYITYYTENCFG